MASNNGKRIPADPITSLPWSSLPWTTYLSSLPLVCLYWTLKDPIHPSTVNPREPSPYSSLPFRGQVCPWPHEHLLLTVWPLAGVLSTVFTPTLHPPLPPLPPRTWSWQWSRPSSWWSWGENVTKCSLKMFLKVPKSTLNCAKCS